MKTDKIIELPNQHTVHGLRVQKYPRTGYVFCNGEDRVPIPNDGSELEPETYQCVFTAVNGDDMTVAWQILVDGNLDSVDADYQGKYAFATCYNSEEGLTLPDMMASEMDWVVIFNLQRIEEAVANGEAETINGVPVLDGKHGSPYTRYVPIPNSPHGHQHRARRHPRRRQRQAVTDLHGLRRHPLRRALQRRDRGARYGGGRAGAGARTAPHRLRRAGQCLHDALHRQPSLQVEHR